MQNTTFQIEKGEVFTITATGAQATNVWSIQNGAQDTLKASLATSEVLVLGPYLNVTEFRAESESSFTLVKNNPDFGAPAAVVPVAGAVDDAVDETDIVAQFNLLLASLRTAGLVAEE
jgi:hypothetical protein